MVELVLARRGVGARSSVRSWRGNLTPAFWLLWVNLAPRECSGGVLTRHAGYFNAGGLCRRGIPAGRVSCATRTRSPQADKERFSCTTAELWRPPDPPAETRAAACRRCHLCGREAARVSASNRLKCSVSSFPTILKISDLK